MNTPTLNDLCRRAEALAQDLRTLRENEKPPPFVPKFKVGDRVRTKRGNVFTVDSLLDERMYSLVGSAGVFDEDDLEPAPWTLSRHIPTFRPLEEGEQWHREDGWTEDMLPEGWRPLVKGEDAESGDQYLPASGVGWKESKGYPAVDVSVHYRTRRALPDTEREAFEKWARDYYTMTPISWESDIKQYEPTHVHGAWVSWQAARKAQ